MIIEQIQFLGMGIYYSKKCHPDELTARAEIETLTRAEGYPELESIMCLSAAAVDSPRLSSVYNIDQYQYLELVVTAPAARGLGVATGIIKHVQSEDQIIKIHLKNMFLLRSSEWSAGVCGHESWYCHHSVQTWLETLELYPD